MNRYTAFGVITALLFALLPFATSRHLFYGAINTKYFLVLSATVVLAGIAARYYYQGKVELRLANRPLLWTGVALLAIYWLSAFLGIFPERSIFSDIQRSSGVFFLTHLAALALLLGECATARDWSLIRRTIVLSAALFGFFTILGTEGLGISQRIFWTNLDINGYTFGNSTFAGTYLVLALIIALLELLRTTPRTRWWYVLFGSAALIFFSPILFNVGALLQASFPIGSARASSATAWLLLVFFGGYVLLQHYGSRYKKYVLPLWGAGFLLAVVGGIVLLFTPGSVVQNQYIEASTAARVVVWEEGLKAFQGRPLLGSGPENVEQALQGHFDNRLYEDEYYGEVWFDRAHNIIIDTLVQTGIAGVLGHLVLVGTFVWVVYRARRQGVIGEPEAMLLYALPIAHLLQLQTGFDTMGSYALLGVFGGYGLYLERQLTGEPKNRGYRVPNTYSVVGSGAIVVLCFVSAYLLYAEFSRQSALFNVVVETNAEKRLMLIATATSRLSSFESLRSSSLSLTKGVLNAVAEGKANQRTIEAALNELQLYEDRYRRYLERQPGYYRAHIALAYVLSVETVLGGDGRLQEAKALVERGYTLSPGNLLTPAMDALLELYSGNIASAKQKAQELVTLNPRAPFSREVMEHILKQERTFPTITVLRLENL